MAVAVAAILRESDASSPVKTRDEDFSALFDRAALDRNRDTPTEMGGFIDALWPAREVTSRLRGSSPS